MFYIICDECISADFYSLMEYRVYTRYDRVAKI